MRSLLVVPLLLALSGCGTRAIDPNAPCAGRGESDCKADSACRADSCPNCSAKFHFVACVDVGAPPTGCPDLDCPVDCTICDVDETQCAERTSLGCTPIICPDCHGGSTYLGCGSPCAGLAMCPICGACRSNSDCGAGKACMPPDAGGDCIACIDPGCGSDADCTSGDVCSYIACCGGMQCTTPCTSNASCGEGLSCDAGGHCLPTACSSAADCPGGFDCTNGSCQRHSCANDADCTGSVCVEAACYTTPGVCG